MLARYLLVLMLLVSPVLAEQIDNCASVLGSLAVELRIARALPPGRSTTFVCPRDSSPLMGASKARILNSLGTPDVTGPSDGAPGSIDWSYFFSSSVAGHSEAGIPELTFSFDEQQRVSGIRCQRTQ